MKSRYDYGDTDQKPCGRGRVPVARYSEPLCRSQNEYVAGMETIAMSMKTQADPAGVFGRRCAKNVNVKRVVQWQDMPSEKESGSGQAKQV